MNKTRIILFIILILVIFLGFFLISNHSKKQPVDINSTEEIYFSVENGDEPLGICEKLVEQGLIKNEGYLYNLFLKYGGQIYANTYLLSPSMTPEEIYEIITDPISNFEADNNLLIYEGELLVDIASELAKQLEISDEEVLNYWSDTENLNTWINQYEVLTDEILNPDIMYPLEGYLYPATYDVLEDDTLESMTTKILDETNAQYSNFLTLSNPLSLTLHESLSLASIVERESIFDEDKYKIAGVFYNRINLGMPIQSDITVLYALEDHKELVTYEDLEVDSPYNTYIYSGITPGPISSVSLSSLDAVYNPEDNDYIYFFAKQDTGEVLYSETYEEHLSISDENAWE